MRELQNCMERAVILTEGDTIHARHLSLSAHAVRSLQAEEQDAWARIDLSGTLSRSDTTRDERSRAAKDRAGRSRTSAAIEVTRPTCFKSACKTLITKLKDYGLE